MKYALIKDGIVINIIIWDGISEYNTPHELIRINEQYKNVDLGYTYLDGVFTAPVVEIV